MTPVRTYRAGSSIEDYCRACKADRTHTVVAVTSDGWPIRVICEYCRSEHNYRGGPRVYPSGAPAASARAETPHRSLAATPEPFPMVSDRERTSPLMSSSDTGDLELLLRRVLREEGGLSLATPADKWRGGSLVLRPGTPGLQEKSWPIETFFHKVVMLRNRLRTLEQQLNASELPDDTKVKLQAYITGCYGSLTSFNILFAEEEDQFKGAGGD
jgi:hypothetical protein